MFENKIIIHFVQIINLLTSLENTAFTMKANCWLRDFESFLTGKLILSDFEIDFSLGALLPSPDDPSSFSSFLYLFFQHPLYRQEIPFLSIIKNSFKNLYL